MDAIMGLICRRANRMTMKPTKGLKSPWLQTKKECPCISRSIPFYFRSWVSSTSMKWLVQALTMTVSP